MGHSRSFWDGVKLAKCTTTRPHPLQDHTRNPKARGTLLLKTQSGSLNKTKGARVDSGPKYLYAG